MKPLSDFLAKYKTLGLGERLSREVFVEVVNDVLGQKMLRSEDVVIKDGAAHLTVPGPVKSEIMLNKAKILEKAAEKAGTAFLIKRVR
ncbi:MAG: hypothetical protein HYV68_02065 [Candidatus Taylorbacteria bacterium]|nr:hypothetical protein [Candidatus Taylorbacteria bacterium]